MLNKSNFRRFIANFLAIVLSLNGLMMLGGSFSRVQAQRRIIVVHAEQPNVWTLEQAHYLLAQMHRRNLDLKTKSLGDLDPNEIAGLRFDVMRMLIEFGATFNQADLETNRLLSENRTFNAERRQELLKERDGLRRDSRRLAGEIEELEIEKAATEDEEAKRRIDARITAKSTRQARIDKDIETLNSELGTLTAPSGNPAATTGGASFDKQKLPSSSSFDDAFTEAAKKQISKFSESPQLNASLRLDNFLQMQYEIISKQLSLLRDELGPGERLLFLELPQTVNAAHHEANKKWAQSWWRIAGYTKRVPAAMPAATAPTPRLMDSYRPITTTQDMESILRGEQIVLPVTPCFTGDPVTFEDTQAIMIGESSKIFVPTSAEVRNITVTLHGFTHARPDNVDVLLVGPQGQNILLLSDAGGNYGVHDLRLTFEDGDRTPILADTTVLSEGTYRPTNHDPTSDNFPNLRVMGGSKLSVFNGTNPHGEWKLVTVDDSGTATGSISGGWSLNIATDCREERRPETAFVDEFVNLDDDPSSGALNTYLNRDRTKSPRLENRMVRTVELIPRHSSLNVSDMKLNVRAGAFNFVLSTLFGFGSQLNIQRQREQFAQFVQQELYSAAFGKGSREFGWTFTPMPGMDRLQSGVRTTYAIVVVPDDASSLILESNGCYFPRSSYQPNNFEETKSREWNVVNRTSRNCSAVDLKARGFVVPIPAARVDGGNEFWVDRINFEPVPKGGRVVVSVSGKNFSPQIGALIDGVPLLHSIGLAQPLHRDDSETGKATVQDLSAEQIRGRIERIDSEKIVLSFNMPPEYRGTPNITLIAPGRAANLNTLPIAINGSRRASLSNFIPRMFGHIPDPPAFRIDRVRVSRGPTDPGPPPRLLLTALISGDGFIVPRGNLLEVLVNGNGPRTTQVLSEKLVRITFDPPSDDSIRITLVSTNPGRVNVKTAESEAIPNPAFLRISNVEVITYDEATDSDPATLVVKITGSGFTDSLITSAGEIAVQSATEAILTIPDPRATAIVIITDTVTGQSAKAVITRKSKSPK